MKSYSSSVDGLFALSFHLLFLICNLFVFIFFFGGGGGARIGCEVKVVDRVASSLQRGYQEITLHQSE